MRMNIVNIMNFVRGCEPRFEIDLVEPVRQELALCRKYDLPNTFLFQYDALVREDLVSIVKGAPKTEVGVWLEMAKCLTEKVGIPWRGREGYDWDWYVDPGFLPSYTQEERARLIDEIMRLFKEIFGEYPRSAGSWVIDAFSMEYMEKKYGVKAFGICREEWAVDAYTLQGGYYNQGYYPSRLNNLCPAQTRENQINAPVFRLLGPCPVFNYGLHWYEGEYETPPTIEPCSQMGTEPQVVRWFFDNYFHNESLAFSYIQLGQENSFGWEGIKKGLPMQFEILDEYVKSGQCQVMTMGDTGEWFQTRFDRTPATSLIADSNPLTGTIDNSVWYDCVNYRANLVTENGRLYFRDIYKFREDYVESCYDQPCRDWQITYDNLPVMDGYLWRREDDNRAGIYFDGQLQNFRTFRDGDSLVAEAVLSGKTVRIEMAEKGIIVFIDGSLRFSKKPGEELTFSDTAIRGTHKGYAYEVGVTGRCSADGVIAPENGKIILDMTR